jgi:hypothetical protein
MMRRLSEPPGQAALAGLFDLSQSGMRPVVEKLLRRLNFRSGKQDVVLWVVMA